MLAQKLAGMIPRPSVSILRTFGIEYNIDNEPRRKLNVAFDLYNLRADA